jgi:hypothetical protein
VGDLDRAPSRLVGRVGQERRVASHYLRQWAIGEGAESSSASHKGP